MHTKSILALLFLCITPFLQAEEMSDHSGTFFHAFTLQLDAGNNKNDTVNSWDFSGWAGDDNNKLWLKAEGDEVDGHTETSEIWALYSRNIATFWDFQAGIRNDDRPYSNQYLVVGFSGLAPYFFNTEAYIFVDKNSDASARLREENAFYLARKLLVEPYLQLNLYAEDNSNEQRASGLTDGEIGFLWRYEITRKIAPYIDMHYSRLLGDTHSQVKKTGGDTSESVTAVGIEIMF